MEAADSQHSSRVLRMTDNNKERNRARVRRERRKVEEIKNGGDESGKIVNRGVEKEKRSASRSGCVVRKKPAPT